MAPTPDGPPHHYGAARGEVLLPPAHGARKKTMQEDNSSRQLTFYLVSVSCLSSHRTHMEDAFCLKLETFGNNFWSRCKHWKTTRGQKPDGLLSVLCGRAANDAAQVMGEAFRRVGMLGPPSGREKVCEVGTLSVLSLWAGGWVSTVKGNVARRDDLPTPAPAPDECRKLPVYLGAPDRNPHNNLTHKRTSEDSA
ncbi:hypothetical protein BaRGS_00009890 [Batillaria attramentaria]|uniref:Uncharacterized protein n=1 Tax=Batillaria attramentaria TaxID=370345 RepID=A0ABD0LI77_9CAEN